MNVCIKLLLIYFFIFCHEIIASAKGDENTNNISSICLYGINQNVITPVAEDRVSFFDRWQWDGAKHDVICDSIRIRELVYQLENAQIIDTLSFNTKQTENKYFTAPSGWLIRKTEAKEPIGAIIINYKNGIPFDIIWISGKTMYMENMEYIVPKTILDQIKTIDKRPSKKMVNLLNLRQLPEL